MSSNTTNSFRFLPRFRAIAVATIAIGVLVLAYGTRQLWSAGDGFVLPMGVGTAGVLLGLLYLLSPTWRLRVLVDDEALAVVSPHEQRFRLPWSEIVEVVASPATETCFVDGGKPETSLLVPGPGAPASYDIAGKSALYQAICAHVPGERIREVALLSDVAGQGARPASGPEGGGPGDAGEGQA